MYYPKCAFVRERYSLFDKLVTETQEFIPVMFNEDEHLLTQFSDNKQRARFFEEMQLSVPIDMYRNFPEGSQVSIVFVS